jgi:tRNA threonylcarbamoyladenosine biosynthesis protein TsaB
VSGHEGTSTRAWRLVLDTATRRSTLAIGDGPTLVVADVRDAGHRHGSMLLDQLDEALHSTGVRVGDLGAIGVGTGPGSFTGLRVGLATAKTLAWSLGLPLVGVSTVEALRRAASRASGVDSSRVAVVLPAGARDHYVALPGMPPVLVPPDRTLSGEVRGFVTVAVDVAADRLGGIGQLDGTDLEALCRGALEGLAIALLELTSERLLAGPTDDPATLVPGYVALPRGVTTPVEGMTWSPDPR